MNWTRTWLAIGLMATTIQGWAGSRYAETPVPQDDRTFFVDETTLPIDALPGATAQWGVLNGAGYRIEVPVDWQGDLFMFAHGFRGTGEELTVDSPPDAMRRWMIDNGIAWAASSYTKNYYDVRAGVQDTNDLARYFKRNVGKPKRVFITGFSMGGHITGAAIEQFPNLKCPDGRKGRFCKRIARILGKLSGGIKYSGAAPFCGVMGDTELVDYFADFNRGAETLAGISLEDPTVPPADYFTNVQPQVRAALEDPVLGAQHFALAQMISGGPRPGFAVAFGTWREFLLGFGGGTLDFDGVVSGSLYNNFKTVYQFDVDPELTAAEKAFNANMPRLKRAATVNPRRFLKLQRIPEIHGRLALPVVSTHTLGDLFVPFSMQQIYAREAKARGRSGYLVSRGTRAIGHCEFSPSELVAGVEDMYNWANGGSRPDGDDVLDVEAVASPTMGCDHSITDVFPGFGSFPASRAAFAACPGE